MGERLLSYYKYIAQEVGISGKVKLAQATKIPSTKAAFEPDNALNLSAFKTAVSSLTGKPAPDL